MAAKPLVAHTSCVREKKKKIVETCPEYLMNLWLPIFYVAERGASVSFPLLSHLKFLDASCITRIVLTVNHLPRNQYLGM